MLLCFLSRGTFVWEERMLAAALSSRRNSSVRFQTFYIIYIMRNRTVDAALHRRGLLLQPTPQEADWTMTFDTYERVDLTGPWAGDCRAGNAPVPAGIHPICRGHTPHISRSLDKSPQL
ncbi:hypothetical protein BRM90_22155 [Xanthomonas oryzae pv. oryzae]|nr:hypothetical protein BRM90_22155 [Xanthomonas oryzae pv. oryzae]